MAAASVSIRIDGADAAAAMLGDAAEKIRAGIQKGLAEAGEIVTADAKANCPVDTGNLRASITKSVSGSSCEVGTNVHYAGYVEFGTCKMAAQPYLVPALLGNVGAIEETVKAAIGL